MLISVWDTVFCHQYRTSLLTWVCSTESSKHCLAAFNMFNALCYKSSQNATNDCSLDCKYKTTQIVLLNLALNFPWFKKNVEETISCHFRLNSRYLIKSNFKKTLIGLIWHKVYKAITLINFKTKYVLRTLLTRLTDDL